MNWRDKAACKKYPTEWWFPLNSRNTDGEANRRRAIEICNSCPVAEKCLDDSQGEIGIWGGLDTEERQSLLKFIGSTNPEKVKMPRHTCGTEAGYAAIYRFNKRYGTSFVCEPCNVGRAYQKAFYEANAERREQRAKYARIRAEQFPRRTRDYSRGPSVEIIESISPSS